MKGGGSMTVVYVDSVFVLNALMDYLLLLTTARLAGVPLRRKRYVLAALLGGLYAVAVFLPGLGYLAETPVKVAVGTLLALIAYGGEEKLLRLILLLFLVSCALAGCVLGLGLLTATPVPVVRGIFYTDVDAKVLAVASAAGYCVLTLVFRASAKRGIRGELLPVRVSLGERRAELTALYDTGNGLRDPATGRPVLVVAKGALDTIFSAEVRELLTGDALMAPADLLGPLRQAAPELRTWLVPYQAVGVNRGLLLAIRSDWTEVAGERYESLIVALAPTALGTGYGALWGGPLRTGGEHGIIRRKTAAPAGEAGAVGRHGDTLYRRQRHVAAAADPGAGGGAVGTDRRGGCPERTDRT